MRHSLFGAFIGILLMVVTFCIVVYGRPLMWYGFNGYNDEVDELVNSLLESEPDTTYVHEYNDGIFFYTIRYNEYELHIEYECHIPHERKEFFRVAYTDINGDGYYMDEDSHHRKLAPETYDKLRWLRKTIK